MAMLWAVIAAVAVMAVAWLIRIDSAMHSVPEEARKASPRRWTKEQLRETYERVKQKPLDFRSLLPPRLDRRYVVVGGSGEPLPPSTPPQSKGRVRHRRGLDFQLVLILLSM